MAKKSYQYRGPRKGPSKHDHVGQMDWSDRTMAQCTGCGQAWIWTGAERGWKAIIK